VQLLLALFSRLELPGHLIEVAPDLLGSNPRRTVRKE